MTERYPYQTEDPVHALDLNQDRHATTTGVIDGLEATYLNGMDVEIESGEVWFGDIVDVDETVVTLESDSALPRKAVVYADSGGDIEVVHGEPAEAQPVGKSGVQTYQPMPPDLRAVDAVALWEVWIPAGVGALETEHIVDRRSESLVSAHTLEAHGASVESTPEDDEDVARKAEIDAVSDDISDVDDDLEGHREDVADHDNVDVAALLEGDYGERPDAGDVDDGTRFFATDRRIMFRSDGEDWEPISGVGTEEEPIPDTTHFESVSAESTDTDDLNGADFTAAGDGESLVSDGAGGAQFTEIEGVDEDTVIAYSLMF